MLTTQKQFYTYREKKEANGADMQLNNIIKVIGHEPNPQKYMQADLFKHSSKTIWHAMDKQ